MIYHTKVMRMSSILSFELCNSKLLERGALINIPDYISLTHMIPLNLSNDYSLSEMTTLIYFMVDIAHIAVNDFVISMHDLERIGFRPQDTVLNRFRQLINQPVELLDNDLALLKKGGLKRGRDFIMNRMHLSTTSEDMDIEYKVSPKGFYRLIAKKYGRSFLTALNARVFQIILHYHTYVNKHYELRMRSLNNTIHGLSDDINQLVSEHSHLKQSQVFHNTHDCPCANESFISNDSKDSYIRQSHIEDGPWTPKESDSPISVVMESPKNLLQLSNSLEEFDDHPVSTPKSMIGSHIDSNHVDMLQKRFQTYLQSNLNDPTPIFIADIVRPKWSNKLPKNATPWRRVGRHSSHQ